MSSRIKLPLLASCATSALADTDSITRKNEVRMRTLFSETRYLWGSLAAPGYRTLTKGRRGESRYAQHTSRRQDWATEKHPVRGRTEPAGRVNVYPLMWCKPACKLRNF